MPILLVAAAVIASFPATAKPTPVELEVQTWRAFKSKRVDEIRTLFASNFVGLYADGTHDLARELKGLQTITIDDYRLTPFEVHAIDPGDVLLTYSADVRLRVSKKPISERLWMSSLWHREGGRWLCVYHTEIKAK
jgi:hypothetical protein